MAARGQPLTDPIVHSPPSWLVGAVEQIAESPMARACSRFFTREKKWITEQQLEICRVPAPTFQEQERAGFLVQRFADIGYAAKIDEAGNVIVPIVFNKRLPYVAVTAHMDTAMAPRRPADVNLLPDGTLQGPGVTDNGAGLSALLALARALREAGEIPRPAANLLLAANVAEEGEGNLYGINYLCRQSWYATRVHAYVVLDGASIGHITAEALGSRRFEIVFEGNGGHSWNDFGRANPVHALGRTVALLADTELPESPRTTLTVGVMEGGSSINSIPSRARVKVDIRSNSNAAAAKVVAAMEEAVRLGAEMENRRSTDRLTSYRIREIGFRPAAPFSTTNHVAGYMQAVDTCLGIRSRLDCASTDANVPLAMGLAAVAIGAGGRGGEAHTRNEWYHPEGRELGLQRVALLLLALLRPPSWDGRNGAGK